MWRRGREAREDSLIFKILQTITNNIEVKQGFLVTEQVSQESVLLRCVVLKHLILEGGC